MKRLLAVLIGISVVLTGCKKDVESVEEAESTVSLQQASSGLGEGLIDFEDIDFYDPNSVVNAFLQFVWIDDMESAFKCVNFESTDFISIEDFEYCLHQSNLSSLIGSQLMTPTALETVIKGSVAYATFYPDPENERVYERLNCVLREDGTWKVTPVYWVATEYFCYVPEGVRFLLNDREVTDNYKVAVSNGLDVYRIPDVPCREINTKIISSTFGGIDGKITPVKYTDFGDNTAYKAYNEIPKVISNELFNTIAGAVGGLYNQVFSGMDRNASATLLNAVIGNGKNYKFLEKAYSDGVKARENQEITSVEVLEITPNTTTVSYVYDAKTVVINMNLKIHWLAKGSPCEENIAGAAKVVYENGAWKLDDITASTWSTLVDKLNTTSENPDNWKSKTLLEEIK